MRQLTLADKLILQADRALQTLTRDTREKLRPSPAQAEQEGEMNSEEKRHAAGLMRVNHSGEVCAQALYMGQALTAKLPEIRKEMEVAADEEIDHLAWCEQRLTDLGYRPSLLNPVWYGLSFGIGAGAGLISDKVSLGFVAATEDQVCLHLESHLQSLPEQDHKSRAVVEQMLIDEAKHSHTALEAGGIAFPTPIKALMTKVSTAMTETSYRI
ncbi:MAG: 2-polyprenyl-3-methyl-6-methoxy-1,4-benzoquinone monooxygenase [Cellvibrionaceae bacterium]